VADSLCRRDGVLGAQPWPRRARIEPRAAGDAPNSCKPLPSLNELVMPSHRADSLIQMASLTVRDRSPGRTAAKYSNLPQRSPTSTTLNMQPTLDFNRSSRSTPVATDQKVGGSSPSERAQLRGRLDGQSDVPLQQLTGPQNDLSATVGAILRSPPICCGYRWRGLG